MKNTPELNEALAKLAASIQRVEKAMNVFGLNMNKAHDLILAGMQRTHLLAKMRKPDPPMLYMCNGEPFTDPVYITQTHAGNPGVVVPVGQHFVVVEDDKESRITNAIPGLLERGLAEMFQELELKIHHENK